METCSKTLTLSLGDSHAKTYPSAEKEKVLKERNQVFGQRCTVLLGRYDQDLHSLRTYQCSLFGEEQELLATLPSSAMIRNGKLYQQDTLEHRTYGTGFGSSATHSIPTPTASDHIERKSTSSETMNFDTNKTVTLDRFVKKFPRRMPFATPSASDSKGSSGGGMGRSLRTDIWEWKKMFPTPTAQDSKNDGGKSQHRRNSIALNTLVKDSENQSGQLSPTFVEWLMGFPIGWTELEDSETQ